MTYEEIYIYKGDDPSVEVESYKEVVKTTAVWQKKKADRNCLSADPNDCLVWCLVEVPEYEIHQVVKDTTQTKEWESHVLLKYKKGQIVNTPVLCDEEITEDLLNDIKNKLILAGYKLKESKRYKRLDKRLFKRLKNFQKDNRLGIGDLTKETMIRLSEI